MFAVELPLGEPVKLLVRRRNAFRPARIAIIENNSYVTAALACALSNVGHQVVSAATPETIMPLLAGRRPDFVLADYRLSGQATGFDAITSLRTIFGRHLPAIIITGDTDPALIRRMARKEIAVMHKPIDLDALLARIEEESLRSA
jgi:DNA-binding NtrC family response regulator